MKIFTLQTPQATVHSSLVADAWLAWHSIHRSIMWLRQIAQLSTTISAMLYAIISNKEHINTIIERNLFYSRKTGLGRYRSYQGKSKKYIFFV